MSKPRASSAKKRKLIKNLEINLAYSQYKIRSAGDLDSDLENWTSNIMDSLENEKAKNKNSVKKTK